MKVLFADVIMPLAVAKAFTYRVPREMNPHIKVGMRAVVPFGKQRLLTGIVGKIHENPPDGYTAKYVDDLLDVHPVVNYRQLRFWNWIAEYYMCDVGAVFSAAVPGAMRLTSSSRYVPNPAYDGDLDKITPDGETVLFALGAREVMTGDEIADLLGKKSVQSTIKSLIEAGAVIVMEELKEKYKPKVVTYLKLSDEYADEAGLQNAFERVNKAPRQEDALMRFIELSGRYAEEAVEVRKTVLQKVSGVSASVVNTLVEKGIFEVYEKTLDRLPVYGGEILPPPTLSPAQRTALEGIRKIDKPVSLLHGITSSGKTEIYVELMREQLERGKQVLYMLPEIALTTQIILRLQSYFGDQVMVYHSRLNQQERVELWMSVMNPKGRARLILGARSAVFLPFVDLGLVIVDEEHENSFKQFQPAPRYHARDAAIVLASLHGARTLLGSATPSLESMHNVRQGKYGYVQLTERYGGMEPPEIHAVPLPIQKEGYFSKALIEAMQETLDKREQVILFQNRRGYAPVLVCLACGWSPECTRCDVTVTYHKHLDRYVCHYCGNRYSPPPACPACGGGDFKLAGFGTERIEEELPIYFPDARTARLDLDSTRSKSAYSQILNDFQDGFTDILIGTQMVTKGLDFERVSLVGILNADLLLKFPDFRSTERGFQLMMQVAGRAGRRHKRGKVLIQTRNSDHWVIRKVIEDDFQYMLEHELHERKEFLFPPFCRLIKLTLAHRDKQLVDYSAAEYHRELLGFMPPALVLGPEYPSVKRIKNRYNKDIILKITSQMNLAGVKEKLRKLNTRFFANKEFRSVRLVIDVDPQ